MGLFPHYTQSILIQAPRENVWASLTTPARMNAWIFDEQLDIFVGKGVGDSFTVKGQLHGIPFENSGKILQLEPLKQISFSHLSSLSGLPDRPDSYAQIEFNMRRIRKATELTIHLRDFPTESIYKHLVFYWTCTLGILKTYIEKP